ncbi:hypothetical protein GCM10010413_49980 [Promicromonospora sukumoe]|uniref:Tox-REase-2 domain-containing protein n=1 Tax=Promicromonospora sukumoe TaxID=88382 RepID=A0A7W3PBZ2_9MICO|nr:PT domain-containing protein [Promicromonospora sukumoe]MBA8806370.1 hypothetical protein [Promicromonospora sukumoe]
MLAGSLAWLAGLWLFAPELRLGMRAYLGCLWVVIAWFALARTKTLTWSGFLGFFTLCVPWSVGIGLITTTLAGQVAQLDMFAVTETGAQVAIAGIAEEAGKLVPVVVLALLAPRRAARFAVVDWVLLGLASGTAFLAVEESVRRTALATGNAGFGSLLGLTPDGVLPPDYVRFALVPIPTPMSTGGALLAPTTVAEFGGHAIMTALVTGVVGLAVAAWQARHRLIGLALAAMSVVVLWSTVADHAMYNAGTDLFSALPGDDGTPAWLDPASTTIPWWLRIPWSLLGHGHGRIPVFLLLVVMSLLVDATRLAARPAANLTGRPAPTWAVRPLPHAPTMVNTVVDAVTSLIWIVTRDLAQAIAGHARRRLETTNPAPSPSPSPRLQHVEPTEPRRAAADRGAALVSGQRALRELAYEHAAARTHPWARRLAAVAVLAGVGWLVFAAAPATAREIGTSTNDQFELPALPDDLPTGSPPGIPTAPAFDPPTQVPTDLPTLPPTDLPTVAPSDLPTVVPSDLPTFEPDDFPSLDPDFEFPSLDPATGSDADDGTGDWLAGVLDALADWWHDQPLLAQLAIGAGIAALIVLSGGSLGLALGISGVLTWGLDKSAGIATFVRDPRQATRDYFATATPTQLAADTLGVALTFAPGNFAGAATGRILRTTADDLVADPAVWWTTRREMFTHDGLADETGAINMAAFLRRDPVPLADGTTKAALSPADEAAAAARYDSYASTSVKGSGPAKDYQVKVYGENERVIPIGTNAEGKTIRSEPDGFTAQYGAVGDSKHISNESSSFYIPDSLPKEGLREAAITKMDKTLTKLQQAANKVMDGDGVVELTTNSTKAAEFIETRMKALGIRGYVRIVPE